MKKFITFLIKLIKTSKENNLFSLANELTYKLLLALFPFIIFLMTLVGFFNIDYSYFIKEIGGALPDAVYDMLNVFIAEVVDVKRAGVLSVSLFISIYSSSSGFLAVMRGINKAYGQKEARNFIVARIVSILLVLILATGIILSITSLVFGDIIYAWIGRMVKMTPTTRFLIGFFGYLITMIILLVSIIVIYHFASSKKTPFYSLIPGALTTLIVWIIASKAFNIYINNFAKFSAVYGSIGSVFVLMYWLNIISVVLLVGGEINALLYEN